MSVSESEVREQLRRESAEIASRLRDVGGLPTEAKPRDVTGANPARDEADESQASQTSDMAMASRERLTQRRRQIRAALERLDRGEYGHCLDCGRLIEAARLRAMPEVETCLACQERREQAERETPEQERGGRGATVPRSRIMRCEEIMNQELEVVREQDSVQAAAQRMRDANIGFVPVCADSLRVVGTVTDRDLAVRVCAENRPADTTQVGEIMTRDVVTCRPSDDVRHAERLMGEHQKARIMVIDEAEVLVGVISLSDIAEREAPQQAARTLRDVSAREGRRLPRETPRASRAVGRRKRRTA
jgi:CBS domain-containing protein/RNA polymerase-binding transcription factor DksA